MSHGLVGDGKHDHDEPKTGIARARRRVSMWRRCWWAWKGRNPGKAAAMIDGVRAVFLLGATIVGSGWGALKALDESFFTPLKTLAIEIGKVREEQIVIAKSQEEIKQDTVDNKTHVILMQQRTSQYNEDIKEIKTNQFEAHRELESISNKLNNHLIESTRRK